MFSQQKKTREREEKRENKERGKKRKNKERRKKEIKKKTLNKIREGERGSKGPWFLDTGFSYSLRELKNLSIFYGALNAHKALL